MPRDALRAHVVTTLIFSLSLGVIALVWEFPRFFLFLLLTCVAAIAYMRLFALVEARLEVFETGADIDEPVMVERPRRRKRKRAPAPAPQEAAATPPGNGSTVPIATPATPVTAQKP
jgi:hypothetical protein